MSRIFRLSFWLLLLLIPGMTQAAGIGISPEHISLTTKSDQEHRVHFSIHNTGKNKAFYQVYLDKFSELILLSDSQLALDAGEARSVELTVKSFPPGQYSTDISVVAQDAEAIEGAPKTGLKVPVSIKVEQVSPQLQNPFIPWIAGLLVLGLLALLVSVYRSSHQSLFSRFTDRISETALHDKPLSMIGHYKRRHPFIIVSVISVLVAIALLILSFLVKPQYQVNQESEEQPIDMKSAQVVLITTPDLTSEYMLSASELTAFSALQLLQQQEHISMVYDDSSEMGVFVSEINGWKNGLNGKYWVYEINGDRVPIASDKRSLGVNEELEWKFIVPSDINL